MKRVVAVTSFVALMMWSAVVPAAGQQGATAKQPGGGSPPAPAPEPRADLDRLSDLVLRMDDLRADGADDVVLADARAAIAAELRLDPAETESAPPSHRSARDAPEDSTNSDSGSRARIQKRALAREAQILARKRVLVRELRLLQLRIDAGTDNAPALEAEQDTMLIEYLSLSREEIRIGARELRQDPARSRPQAGSGQ